MIPKYADEYGEAKLNKNADKEYLNSLKPFEQARVLGSKAKADEAMKNGDITAIFNAMKPERYKVKSISEVAQSQKEKRYSQSEIESIINELKLKQGAKIPQKISIEEFIRSMSFKNSNNFFKHIKDYQDYERRIAALCMVKPTLDKYDLKLLAIEKDNNGKIVEKYKYIKKFNKKYMFISTSKDGNTIYTLFYDMRIKQIEKELLLSVKNNPF